ncbi:hypothetical protein V8C86DRAFT_2813036 [Haematococcus lacustris]
MGRSTPADDLLGKVALVTGANSGIGSETAAALAARGATVILGCRNKTAAQQVAEQIKARFPGAKVDVPNPGLDLMSQESVRSFATEVNAAYPELHILVNNAGVSFMKRCFTEEGVGGIAQTNFLGPYTLTRLLEKKLVSSKARIVTVASIKHREVRIKDARAFLTDWRCGYYEHTKLANVYMAYELQRRLGLLGVTSCAADPGGVRSNIWTASPMFKKGIYRTIIDACYSPPEDGAKCVIHAATVDWKAGVRTKKDGSRVSPADDLRYYSRGLFNNPIITNWDGFRGKGTSWLQHIKGIIWGLTALQSSLLDWPLRKLTRGVLASGCRPVRSSTLSYDPTIAAQLWDVAAETAKVK